MAPAASLSCAEKFPVLFFYSESCENCEHVLSNVLPAAMNKYGNIIELKKLCIDDVDNYRYFLQLEDRFGQAGNDFPIILIQGRFLSGRPVCTEA
jgi:hypothetical protein